METIKWPQGQSPMCAGEGGLSLQPIGSMPALSMSEWVEFNAPPDTIYVISEAETLCLWCSATAAALCGII